MMLRTEQTMRLSSLGNKRSRHNYFTTGKEGKFRA